MSSPSMKHIPNFLTVFRICAIPLLVACFYLRSDLGAWLAFALYVPAAISDFLDGYIARRYNVVSAVGRFLDPIADKLFVGAILFLLVAFDRLEGLWVLPAIAILMREMFIAGLREYLGPLKVTLPVSRTGKWKTAIQMIALGCLIIAPVLPETLDFITFWAGKGGLVIAALLTLVSGWQYARIGFAVIRTQDLVDSQS